MYEEKTFENILSELLAVAPANVDKSEGSMLFNTLAPIAWELSEWYIALDNILTETFADTATREYLLKRAAERAIYPHQATYAFLKGEFNIEIPIGSRFSLDELNYIAVEKLESYTYKMQCETVGSTGNKQFGDLAAIEYINGLEDARLTELIIAGEDEEETEAFRQRYFESFNGQSFGGNVKYYKEKILEIAGVGGVKVYPVWKGGGTVRLVIIASNFSEPSSILINEVQTRTDPVTNQGKGDGFAPIGHIVTVEGVKATAIDVSTNITFREGYTWDDIETPTKKVIENYFAELSKEWDKTDTLVVRIAQIESRMLAVQGVMDVTGTKLNNAEENYTLDADSIPIMGNVYG